MANGKAEDLDQATISVLHTHSYDNVHELFLLPISQTKEAQEDERRTYSPHNIRYARLSQPTAGGMSLHAMHLQMTNMSSHSCIL